MALVVGALVGLVNGTAVAVFGVQPIIATLALQLTSGVFLLVVVLVQAGLGRRRGGAGRKANPT